MSWTELQAQLGESRAAVDHWKSEYQRLSEDRQTLKGELDARRTTADERLLRIISPEALGQVLRQRLAIARTRARGAEAVHRLQEFTRASAGYREALAAPLPAGVTRTTLAGIEWLSPPNAAAPFFDVHAIAQTRDVAIGGIGIEIGARTGLASVARVALGDQLAAYCTEPDPVAYRCLVANVSAAGLDGLVLPDRVAIGEDGPGSLTLDAWIARAGVDVDVVGFVQIKHVTPAILAGATALLAHRHITWQLEFESELLGEEDTAALLELLGARFTHFIVASQPPPGTRVRPVSELEAVAKAAGGDNIALVLYTAAQKD